MGPIQVSLPKGSFILSSGHNSKGEYSILLRYFCKRYYKRTTGIFIQKEQWDAKNQRVRKSHQQAVRLNALLMKFKNRYDSRFLSVSSEPFTPEFVEYILNDGELTSDGHMPDFSKGRTVTPGSDFIKLARFVNELNYSKKTYGYSSWYNKEKYIDMFQVFCVHFKDIRRLKVSDLTKVIFDQYIQYRFDVRKNVSKEGVNKTLVPLYTAVQYAVDNGAMDARIADTITKNFLVIRETVYNPEAEDDKKIRYLTDEQLQKLIKYQAAVKNPRTAEILDFFLFSYYACGMRISDILTLEWRHVDLEKNTIRKMQVKTKRFPDVIIPINAKAKEILLRWKSYGRNSKFVFDLLPAKFDISDERKLFLARNSKDRTFNQSLKVVRMTLKLPFPLTMHVARHTFAVASINKGMSIYLLSKLMGHSSIASTEKVYAEFLENKVVEDTSLVMNL